MEKIITVKGIGHVSVKPDLVVVSLELKTINPNYDHCMKLSGERRDLLKEAVKKSGLPDDSLKTTDFEISTEYHSVKMKDGNYHQVFDGWKCSHDMKVEFSLDINQLTKLLHHVAKSGISCETSVKFTITDPSNVQTELLASAAKNAKTKAETLCTAVGAKLGEIVKIDYNWSEINIYSRTKYGSGLFDESPMPMCCSAPEIDPEDIDVSDNAIFIWRIE